MKLRLKNKIVRVANPLNSFQVIVFMSFKLQMLMMLHTAKKTQIRLFRSEPNRLGLQILFISLAIISFFLAACQHSPIEPSDEAISPTVVVTDINENPHNVLSAVVTTNVNDASNVAIEYGIDSLFSDKTPLVPVTGTMVQIPVLGLKENTSYLMRAMAVSSTGHETKSKNLPFTTSTLPDDIPSMSVLINQSPKEGFVMLGFANGSAASKLYALMVDNDGDVVWYRAFPNPVVDFQKQENGSYTVYSSIDASPLHFYELDNLGGIIGEFQANDDFSTGPHEIRILNGGYCLFAIEQREIDLTGVGGLPNAMVRGTGIEYYRMSDHVFKWSPFEHFQVTDAAPDVALDGTNVNPWHGNAIEIDADDNLLVSFRNLDEITKINTQTGEIVWRLGGKNNEFKFVNDPLNGFSHQHGIRRLPNGNIILFDNGNLHSPQFSRAVEYKLDEKAKIAELVWEYRHDPPIYGFALGFAQRLSNGSTLINYGTAQRVIEVDKSGIKRWEISIIASEHYPYRAFRIDSLY